MSAERTPFVRPEVQEALKQLVVALGDELPPNMWLKLSFYLMRKDGEVLISQETLEP